jgi:YesN/AraC family two-component response regulator
MKYLLEQCLLRMKEKTKEVLGHTVTFGISELHKHSDSVKESVFEALEAVQKRMLQGGDNIFYYEAAGNENLKFHYFYNSENKIINYLDSGDPVSLENELAAMLTGIKNTENISNENILLIFNQLIGSGIKYLADRNINASKVFGHNTNMYTNIENMDTIEDIVDYVNDFFQTIIRYTVTQRDAQVNYFDMVNTYIQEHYQEDFLFEDLADKIGISYSYMRKIVKDETGKSLIDNLNMLRMEQAKKLLLDTQMNVTEIALQVGYRNVQSLNRYFKKYEGISPNQFRRQGV